MCVGGYSSTAQKLDRYTAWLEAIGFIPRTCQRRIVHIRWYNHVSNDEVLRRTGLLAASSIVRKRTLGLFGHVARLADDVPANQILRTCCEAQYGVRPSPDWKSTFSITPLSFDASSPRNPRKYPHKPYIARNYSYWATFLSMTVWVYLHSNFRDGLRKCMYFETECEMADQGHPRSLMSVPVESAKRIFKRNVLTSNEMPKRDSPAGEFKRVQETAQLIIRHS